MLCLITEIAFSGVVDATKNLKTRLRQVICSTDLNQHYQAPCTLIEFLERAVEVRPDDASTVDCIQVVFLTILFSLVNSEKVPVVRLCWPCQ